MDPTRCCVVCGRPFEPEADVVVCPLCGAPHHRSCYQSEGRCHCAAAHGTPAQWRPPLRRGEEDTCVCGQCGTVNPAQATVCSHCGVPLEPPAPPALPPEVDPSVFYADFSPYIGMAPDSALDGNPALDVALFLGPNAGYYLSRFFFLSLQRRGTSWNGAAALFPLGWALYRKQYRLFAWLLPLWLVLTAAGMAALWWMGEEPAALAGYVRLEPWLLCQLAAWGRWALRLGMAFKANAYYRRTAAARIRRAPAGPTELRRDCLRQQGGTAPLAVGLFYGAVASFLLLALVLAAVL